MSGRSALIQAIGSLGIAAAVAPAQATVDMSRLYGDAYIVREGGRIYSVLDVYLKGSSSADVISAIFGVTNYPSSYAVSDGRPFQQSNGSGVSSWMPTNDDGRPWDSYITCGARVQGSQGGAASLGLQRDTNWAASSSGGAIVGVNGGAGWYPAIGASTTTNPYARVGYNGGMAGSPGYWNEARCTRAISANNVLPGQGLTNHWMIGRFTIDVTEDAVGTAPELALKFAWTGKNNGTTTWTTFAPPLPTRGAFYLSFAPRPCDGDIDGDGLCDGWDLGLLLLDFGACTDCATDIDGNGVVDPGDMSLLLLDWNEPCA